MRRFKSTLLFLSVLLFLFITACNKEDSNPIQGDQNLSTGFELVRTIEGTGKATTQSFLTNENMENGTAGYWNGGFTYPQYSFNYSANEYFSPSHSLEITATNAPQNKFVYWAQTFKADEYIGKRVTLTVMTKYYNVDGEGIMFVLRGDNTDFPEGYAEAFASTQNKVVIKGTSDWRKLDVTLESVPPGIKSLTVYMLIASQNGKVFFDNLAITASAPSPSITALANGNFEKGNLYPENWWNGDDRKLFQFDWNSNEYLSPDHSVSISSDDSEDQFSVWGQVISASEFIGKKITLNVNIKAEILNGLGVYIAIRGDDTQSPSGCAEVFSTTQNDEAINGTFDWKKYSITLDDVPSNIKSLTFYLIYGSHTSGKAYFDDVSLVAE